MDIDLKVRDQVYWKSCEHTLLYLNRRLRNNSPWRGVMCLVMTVQGLREQSDIKDE